MKKFDSHDEGKQKKIQTDLTPEHWVRSIPAYGESMSQKFSRRDFLKLSSLYLSYPFLYKSFGPHRLEDSDKPNILIVVYDAFSAEHMSLYGYDRETTPNINRLAKKAIVYHQHYAGGHWTYPGTTSLLTGVLPWSHRGFTRGTKIAQPFDTENIFSYFNEYYSLAYTHNNVSDEVLKKLSTPLDQHYPKKNLLYYKAPILNNFLKNDFDAAAISKRRITEINEEGYASSLFLSHLTESINAIKERELRKTFIVPPEITGSKELFMLEDATDWMIEQLKELPRPYLSYVHLFPPHDPYVVRNDFANTFVNDDYFPIRKPDHFFTRIRYHDNESTDKLRLAYNQAIRYVDVEFGRLMENLEKDGQLDNTIVIMTSDHGEMFERGLTEHNRPVFFQSVIRVPLMIFMPGQKERLDIFEPTSALDIIPTLLHLTGKTQPSILEGTVLPPFTEYDPYRSVFSMDARNNPPEEKLSLYTAMIRKGPYKFTQYFGYKQLPNKKDYFELYNLEEDPEELDNLVDKETEIARELRSELDKKIAEKDQPLKG
jgi:arylsulfatase A-like enzyme